MQPEVAELQPVEVSQQVARLHLSLRLRRQSGHYNRRVTEHPHLNPNPKHYVDLTLTDSFPLSALFGTTWSTSVGTLSVAFGALNAITLPGSIPAFDLMHDALPMFAVSLTRFQNLSVPSKKPDSSHEANWF